MARHMKEGRKYGIVVLLASQGLGDFHPDVPANAGTKIAFRANYPESRKVAGSFHVRKGTDARTILEGLSVGHSPVQTPEMAIAAGVAMYPP
jgi:DNA phosphorothioation-dependent restriction protein DptH